MRCEIIKDLLPLYCDDALSDVSKEEVEKHIAECEDCKKTYEDMKNGDIKLDTASKNIEPLKKVKKKMHILRNRMIFSTKRCSFPRGKEKAPSVLWKGLHGRRSAARFFAYFTLRI